MTAAPQPSEAPARIAALLSTPRLTPYLELTNGNVKEALQLYRWNIELSGALYEAVHVVEVIIRNAVDEQLRTWNSHQRDRATGRSHGSDWLLDGDLRPPEPSRPSRAGPRREYGADGARPARS